MNESITVAKDVDTKKASLSTRNSDERIHRVQTEPERQLDSLGAVVGNIKSNGGTPSADSIATQLSSMHTSQRAPVLLALQQTHGNRYVQQVVAGIQAKLAIGQPGDKYEQEADRVADAVMRMPEPEVQRQVEPEEGEEEEGIQPKPLAEEITPRVQRQDETEEEEEEPIQTKALSEQITPLVQRQEKDGEEEEIQTKPLPNQTSEVVSDVETSINSIRGGGQPLSNNTRIPMEQAFGADFSGVRVHADIESDKLNNTLHARAFTTGQDVFFKEGEYNPGSSGGRELLAHELTHVVQQRVVGMVKLQRRLFLQTMSLEKVLQRAPKKRSKPYKPNPTVRIVVDLSDQKARVYNNSNKLIRTMNISSGKKGHGTPIGNYSISTRDRNHKSSLYGRCTYKPKDFYITRGNTNRCRLGFRAKYKYKYIREIKETGFCPIGRKVRSGKCRRGERLKSGYCIRKTLKIKGGRNACRSRGGIGKLYTTHTYERGRCVYKSRNWPVTKGKTACGRGKYEGAPMPYFQRFNGAIGFHVGKLPGSPASHGCVRLRRSDARWLWNKARKSTKVEVKR